MNDDQFATIEESILFSLLAQRKKDELKLTQKEIRLRLQAYFGRDKPIKGFSQPQISRYFSFGVDNTSDVKSGLVKLPLHIMRALDDILEIGFLAQIALRKPIADLIRDHDARDQIREFERSRVKPMCRVWEDMIERYAKSINRACRVRVAPNNPNTTRLEHMATLATWSAIPLVEAVRNQGAERIMMGLGTTADATTTHIANTQPTTFGTTNWFPSMSTYSHPDFFDANANCMRLAATLGGNRVLEIDTPPYLEYDCHPDDLLAAYQNSSHENLFGPLKATRDSRNLDTHGIHHGFAGTCDTAFLSSGTCAIGAPLWESPGRQRDPINLRKGDYPVVGDINGHYIIIDHDGNPYFLDESINVPDERNREAWDANRRALGARPSMYLHIANQFRSSKRTFGAGNIIVASMEARAPLAYAILHLGVVNTLVLDEDCATKLVKFLEKPSLVAKSIPERFDG